MGFVYMLPNTCRESYPGQSESESISLRHQLRAEDQSHQSHTDRRRRRRHLMKLLPESERVYHPSEQGWGKVPHLGS